MRTVNRWLWVAGVMLLVGCGDNASTPPDQPNPDAQAADSQPPASQPVIPGDDGGSASADAGAVADTGSSVPVLSTSLNQGCFGWPGQEFAPGNAAPGSGDAIGTTLQTGALAVDFTLKDRSGQSHTLSQMLAASPVLLVTGSYTCPVYQNKRTAITSLASKYAGMIKVVHVYTVEAHPKDDVSPYGGNPWPLSFSDYSQPTTYSERVSVANQISLSSDEMMLVDDLTPGTTNEFWCTYGQCPNCAFLIDQTGQIRATHNWFDKNTMDVSMLTLLSE